MSTGLPRSVRNCFGLPAFIRLPTPPANKITDTDSIFESFAVGAAVMTSDAVDDRGKKVVEARHLDTGAVNAVAPTKSNANTNRIFLNDVLKLTW